MSNPASDRESSKAASVEILPGAAGALTLRLSGWLDAHTITGIWTESRQVLERVGIQRIEIDASKITYCDGAGVAMLVDLQRPRAGS